MPKRVQSLWMKKTDRACPLDDISVRCLSLPAPMRDIQQRRWSCQSAATVKCDGDGSRTAGVFGVPASPAVTTNTSVTSVHRI